MGMAHSAVWSRFLSLRHTKITLTNTDNLSVAALYFSVGDRLLTPEMSKSPFDSPKTDLRSKSRQDTCLLSYVNTH
jgi:hypothetical protein